MSEFNSKLFPVETMFGVTYKIPKGMGLLYDFVGLTSLYAIEHYKPVKLDAIVVSVYPVPVEDLNKIKNLLAQSLLLETWIEEPWVSLGLNPVGLPIIRDRVNREMCRIDSIVLEAKQREFDTVLF